MSPVRAATRTAPLRAHHPPVQAATANRPTMRGCSAGRAAITAITPTTGRHPITGRTPLLPTSTVPVSTTAVRGVAHATPSTCPLPPVPNAMTATTPKAVETTTKFFLKREKQAQRPAFLFSGGETQLITGWYRSRHRHGHGTSPIMIGLDIHDSRDKETHHRDQQIGRSRHPIPGTNAQPV